MWSETAGCAQSTSCPVVLGAGSVLATRAYPVRLKTAGPIYPLGGVVTGRTLGGAKSGGAGLRPSDDLASIVDRTRFVVA